MKVEKLSKLLQYEKIEHNEAAEEVFQLARQLIKNQNDGVALYRIISLKNRAFNYPELYENTKNRDFWNILDSLEEQ